MIQAWCDLRGSTNNFTMHVNGVMETFDGLGLSWLFCVPYTGVKLGGWISENYLDLARLMSWFYSEISTVVRDFEFIEPLTPQKDWTMKQNLGWLKIRDLIRGAFKLNANDLIAIVQKYMYQVGGPPPIKQDIGGSVENIEHMLESFSVTMTACMQDGYSGRVIQFISYKIKVFLSDFSTFDNGMKSRNNVLDFLPHHNQLSVSKSGEEEEAAIFDSIDNDVEDGEADYELNYDRRTFIYGTRKRKIDRPKWLM
jgi:hypothetical protein